MVEYKGYNIKRDEQTPNVHVITIGGKGGKTPIFLSGTFTSLGYAKQMIDNYLSKKGVVNETASESGD